MSFASAQFLAFFAVLFVLYYLIPKRHQWKLLLIGSLFFYYFAGWYCLIYIGVTTVTTYLAARKVGDLQREQDAWLKEHRAELDKDQRKAYKAAGKKLRWRWTLACLLLRRLGAVRLKGLPFFKRQFKFFVVLVEHGQGVAEHVGPQDLHAALRGLILLAQAGTVAVETVVVLLLVGKAAQEASADARDLGRIEEKVLLLGHADGHRRELAQVAAAAADHAAVAHRAHHLRFVAYADLAKFDAGAVFAHQILYQLPEVDARRGGKVKDELAAVKIDFHFHKFHVQTALPDALAAEGGGLLRQDGVAAGAFPVLVRGRTQDVLRGVGVGRGQALMRPGDDFGQGLALLGGDDHLIAGAQRIRAGMVARLAERTEFQAIKGHGDTEPREEIMTTNSAFPTYSLRCQHGTPLPCQACLPDIG